MVPTLERIEAPEPSEIQSDSSEYIERAALAAVGLIPADEMLEEGEDFTPSRHIELEEAPGEGWTPEVQQLHPRWPKGTPGGLGGQFMHVGQVFEKDGKEWEIQHIFGSEVVANEASGDYHGVEAKVFDTKQTPGDPDELGGAKRPAAKTLQGGKGSLAEQKKSNITVVDPYVHPETHDPSIPIPKGSPITETEWLGFGRPEQLHYSQVQERFGKHTAGGASKLITKAYTEYDAEIQNYVSSAYQSQYGSSSGYSLSLSESFNQPAWENASPSALEGLRQKREQAKELQGKIRDAYAWDLYNRTHQPDVVIVHKDDQNHGTSWWKEHIVNGNVPLFSGLSQSHHFRKDFWGSQVGILDAVSARQIVMSTWVAGPMKGAHKDFESEQEMAIGDQVRVDPQHAMTFHQSEMPAGALGWLEGQTKDPAGGETFRMFKAAIEEGAPLPIPPPKAEVQMEGENYLPAPQEAADAVAELVTKLPDGGAGNWEGQPSDLKTFDITFKTLDADGNPVAQKAPESKPKPGDYLLGLKGTLYWLGPDPSNSETGLRLYKIIAGDTGKGKVSDESFAFDNSHPNYVVGGYHTPPASLEKETYDPNAWVKSLDSPKPVAQMKAKDTFMVETEAFEILQEPTPNTTTIKSLSSGLVGKINSEFAPHKLELKAGWVPGGAAQPQKGMTFNHQGVKHTITFVGPSGEVSAKAAKAGAKVIKLQPDDPALTSLFDPTAWKKTDIVQAGTLEVGDMFSGGKGDTLRPFRVTAKDETWVNWENLDTGETGKSMNKKKVTALVPVQKTVPGDGVDGPPVDKPHAELEPGDFVKLNQLKVGDLFNAGGHTYSVQSDMQLDSQAKPHVSELKDGVWTQPAPYGSPMDSVTLFATFDSPTGKEAANFPTTASPKADILDSTKPKGLPPGFTPFTTHKSGKVKHPKVKEMTNGAVFLDKAKNEYLVIDTGPDSLVTDGLAVWTVPGDSRGKVLEGAKWTKAVPMLGVTSTTPTQHDLTVDDLGPNDTNLTVAELPIGSYWYDGTVVARKIGDDEYEGAEDDFQATGVIYSGELEEVPSFVGPPETFHAVTITKVSPSAPDNVDLASLTTDDLVLNSATAFGDLPRGEYLTGPSGQSVYRKINETQFETSAGNVEAWTETFGYEIPMHVGLKFGVAKSEPDKPGLLGLLPNELGLSFSEIPVGGYLSGPSGNAMFKKVSDTEMENVGDSGTSEGVNSAWSEVFGSDKPSLVQKGIAPVSAPEIPATDKAITAEDLTENYPALTLEELPVGSYFQTYADSPIRRKVNDTQYINFGEAGSHSFSQLGGTTVPEKVGAAELTHSGASPSTVTVDQMVSNASGEQGYDWNLGELPVGTYYSTAEGDGVMQKVSGTEVALIGDPDNQHIPIGNEDPYVPNLILITQSPALDPVQALEPSQLYENDGGRTVQDLAIGSYYWDEQASLRRKVSPRRFQYAGVSLEEPAEFEISDYSTVPDKVLLPGDVPKAAKTLPGETPPLEASQEAGWPDSLVGAKLALMPNDPGWHFSDLPNGAVFSGGSGDLPIMRKIDEGHYEELKPDGAEPVPIVPELAESSKPSWVGIPPGESMETVSKAGPDDYEFGVNKMVANSQQITVGELPVGAWWSPDDSNSVIGKVLPYDRMLLLTDGASHVGFHHKDSEVVPVSIYLPAAAKPVVADDETYSAASSKLIPNQLKFTLDQLGPGTLYSMGPTTVAKVMNDQDSLVMTPGGSWTQPTPATVGPDGYPHDVANVAVIKAPPIPESGNYDGAVALMKPNATALQFEDLPEDSLFLIDQWTVGKKLGPQHVQVMNDHGETWDSASEAINEMPHPPSMIKLPPGWPTEGAEANKAPTLAELEPNSGATIGAMKVGTYFSEGGNEPVFEKTSPGEFVVVSAPTDAAKVGEVHDALALAGHAPNYVMPPLSNELGFDLGGTAPDAPKPPFAHEMHANTNDLSYVELPVGAYFANDFATAGTLRKVSDTEYEVAVQSDSGGYPAGQVLSAGSIQTTVFEKVLLPGESKAVPVDQALPGTWAEANTLLIENTHGFKVKDLPTGSLFTVGTHGEVGKKLASGHMQWIGPEGNSIETPLSEWIDYVPEKVVAPPTNSGFGPPPTPPDEPAEVEEPEAVALTGATLSTGDVFKNAAGHPFETIKVTETAVELEDLESGMKLQITDELPLEDVLPVAAPLLTPTAIEQRLTALDIESTYVFPHGTTVEKLYFGSKSDSPLFYVNGQQNKASSMQEAMQQVTLSEMDLAKHPPGTYGSMKPGDEFENEVGTPFKITAQGTTQTFFENLNGNGTVMATDPNGKPSKLMPVAPKKSVPNGEPKFESSLTKLIKASEAAVAKDENGKPIWGVTELPTYKSSYSGGTKLPQISQLKFGDAFTPKGKSKQKYLLLRWEPNGLALVYSVTSQQAVLADAATRVKPAPE